MSAILSRIDRLPPHSVEAEQGILGCCILDSEALDQAIESQCNASWFYDLRHQDLWQTLCGLRDERVKIDLITLGQRLKEAGILDGVGGLAYLSQLMDAVPSSANLAYYVGIVSEKSLRRKLLQAATKVMELARDESIPAENATTCAETEILGVRDEFSVEKDPTMRELMIDGMAELEDRMTKGDAARVRTFFGPIDRVTNGGFLPGNMVVIAARPSTGKTSLAITLARCMATNKVASAIFSLEMTRAEVRDSLSSQESGVDWLSVSKENPATKEQERAMVAAAGRLGKMPIHIIDSTRNGKSYNMTVGAIAAKARRLVKKHAVKVVFIDYLQRIPSPSRGDRREVVDEISRKLKDLAMELAVPVIVLAQLNREFEKDAKRKPRLSDLREAGGIEADADFVGMLYSPEPEDMWDEDAMVPVRINMYIAKQRKGVRFVDVPMNFRRAVVRFEPLGPA